MALNTGPLDWESSVLTTRPLKQKNSQFTKMVLGDCRNRQLSTVDCQLSLVGNSATSCCICTEALKVPSSMHIFGSQYILNSHSLKVSKTLEKYLWKWSFLEYLKEMHLQCYWKGTSSEVFLDDFVNTVS